MYSALRRLGFDIDIVSPETALDDYRMVVIPCLPILPPGLAGRLEAFAGSIVIGPRTGSRTDEFAIPADLPPGALQAIFPGKVVRSQSLRPTAAGEPAALSPRRWLDDVEGDVERELLSEAGECLCYRKDRVRYLATWPAEASMMQVLTLAAHDAGLPTDALPRDIRVRRTQRWTFVFNYSASASHTISGVEIAPASAVVLAAASNPARHGA